MFWFSSRLSEKTLYWEPPGRDGKGDYKWGFPEEMWARWKDSGKSIRYDKNGAEVVSSSIVWIDKRLILLGGYLLRGSGLYSLNNLDVPPLEEPDIKDDGNLYYARQIVDIETISSVSDIKKTVTKVWLR